MSLATLQRRPSTAVWVLLFLSLALRSVVPTGYMPMAAASGGLTMALCPDYAPLPGPASDAGGTAPAHHDHHAMAAGAMAMGDGQAMHHGSPAQAAGESAHRHAPCSFAASATPAPALSAPIILAALGPVVLLAPVLPRIRSVAGILRAQSPRAPPALG